MDMVKDKETKTSCALEIKRSSLIQKESCHGTIGDFSTKDIEESIYPETVFAGKERFRMRYIDIEGVNEYPDPDGREQYLDYSSTENSCFNVKVDIARKEIQAWLDIYSSDYAKKSNIMDLMLKFCEPKLSKENIKTKDDLRKRLESDSSLGEDELETYLDGVVLKQFRELIDGSGFTKEWPTFKVVDDFC